MADRLLRPGVKDDDGGRLFAGGLRQNPWADLYPTATATAPTWPRFPAAMAGLFLVLNVLFAFACPLGCRPVANARPGGFADAFFFGDPEGVKKPVARVVDARDSHVGEAAAKPWRLGPFETAEGRGYTGLRPVRLPKSENSAFALSWTLFHPIDETLPLYGLSPDDVSRDDINLVLSIAGLDDISTQIVHTRHVYIPRNLRRDHEFVDMFHRNAHAPAVVDFPKWTTQDPF